MTSTTEELTPQQIEAWKNLANGSNEIFNKIISQMPPEMQQKIQEITGALAQNTTAEEEAGKLANRIENSFDTLNGYDIGEAFAKGIGNGINSTMDYVVKKASQLAEKAKASASSKTQTTQATKSTLPGHKSGLDYVPYDDYIARLHKGERVLTAKENKQLMSLEKFNANNHKIGNLANKLTKNNNIVLNLHFSAKTINEAEMKKCCDFMQNELAKYF